MLPEQLIRLANEIIKNKCEMQNIELKSSEHGASERLYDTLSSFSNQSGGGIIIFGISEKNGFSVSGVYDVQDLQIKVTNQALQMQPVVRPVFTVAEIDGKQIVSAEISECEIYDKPCFYKGTGRLRGSYIRVGESDQQMTEYEIYSYDAFRRKIQDELRIVERASIDYFDKNALEEYLQKIRKTKPNLAMLDDFRILQLQGMVDGGKPTIAGALMLSIFPQAYFPQLSITAVVVPGTKFGDTGPNHERFIDNQRIEGRIPQMLEDAIAFVRRNTRTATIIDQYGKRSDKPEYPLLAIREIILNALIHRDYSIHTDASPIRLILYRDRIEIENPGGLYGRTRLSDLGKLAADTRNPFIAGALEVLIDTENRFSGIPTIMNEMMKAGLTPPSFTDSHGRFKVILYNGQAADIVLKEDFGSYMDISERILVFCRTPRSREEIASFLRMDSPYYVITRYVNPMIESNKIRMTLPEKPKSKKQRFVTIS
jgi:ATP-dependent DNA helicase RecG